MEKRGSAAVADGFAPLALQFKLESSLSYFSWMVLYAVLLRGLIRRCYIETFDFILGKCIHAHV